MSLAETDFEQLVRAHQSRVRAQLRRLTHGDAALADDLAQDTFVLAWRHRADFRGEAGVATWLYRIAYNAFLAHCRRRNDAPPAADPMPTIEPAAPAIDTAQRIDVERALAALPEAERLALIHCFALDLSHAEAASVLGWPLGTLKSHVARGKVRLRAQLAVWRPAANLIGADDDR